MIGCYLVVKLQDYHQIYCSSTCDATLYIPMTEPGVRSLNLSVSVAISLFESRRQLGYLHQPQTLSKTTQIDHQEN